MCMNNVGVHSADPIAKSTNERFFNIKDRFEDGIENECRQDLGRKLGDYDFETLERNC